MKHKWHFTQQGQTLVIVAISMIAFMAILGLVLDGGYAFSMRRSAQNAADAGALAGVRMLCEPELSGGTPAEQAETMANYYALQNGADPGPEIIINEADREVTVIARRLFSTFFLHLIGWDEIPVEASATAGCFTPDIGRGLIPVAWSCREPIEGWPSGSEDCQQQRIDWQTLQEYLADPQVYPELYIVMDSESYDEDLLCVEEDPVYGTLTCNLDGSPDGEPDWLASGGRSWLDLDGSEDEHNCPINSNWGGAQELSEWIVDGFDCPIPYPIWLPEVEGVSADLYRDAILRAADEPLVAVPVFTDYCPDGDPSGEIEPVPPTCEGKFQQLQGDQIRRDPSRKPQYFRIESFAAFYITCARKTQGDHCPGAEKAIELNSETLGQGNNFRTIEGYFIDGTSIPGMSGRCGENEFCPDLGLYTYYLTR